MIKNLTSGQILVFVGVQGMGLYLDHGILSEGEYSSQPSYITKRRQREEIVGDKVAASERKISKLPENPVSDGLFSGLVGEVPSH